MALLNSIYHRQLAGYSAKKCKLWNVAFVSPTRMINKWPFWLKLMFCVYFSSYSYRFLCDVFLLSSYGWAYRTWKRWYSKFCIMIVVETCVIFVVLWSFTKRELFAIHCHRELYNTTKHKISFIYILFDFLQMDVPPFASRFSDSKTITSCIKIFCIWSLNQNTVTNLKWPLFWTIAQ